MQKIPTVLELIHARLRDKTSLPGQRNDPYKLAFVAEGGTQRWVLAGGFGAALEALGIAPDLVVGTSGGGLGAIYVGSGVARGCTCFRYLNRKGFDADGHSRRLIDARRLLRGKPVLDVEGLVDVVFSHRVPVDWDGLRKGPVPIYLTATTREGETVTQPLWGTPEHEQKMALKNTARIPYFAHDVRDQKVLWDGGLAAGIPVDQALALGATHLLVVRCKAGDENGLKVERAERYLLRPRLRRLAPDLHQLVATRYNKYAKTLRWMEQNRDSIVLNLMLPTVPIGPMEMEEGNLFRAMAAAYRHVAGALGLVQPAWPVDWAPEVSAYL